MDPTRPVDSKPVTKVGAKAIGQSSKVTDATHPGDEGKGATQLADTLGDASKAIETAKAETKRIDAARLAGIRDSLASGSYEVDADALADRILDDAFGE